MRVSFSACSDQTANDVYIRFHGTTQWYRHDYTNEELAKQVARIGDSGAIRVWAYFNNDREGYAIKERPRVDQAAQTRGAQIFNRNDANPSSRGRSNA